MNAKQAQELAIKAIEAAADGEPAPVRGTVYVIRTGDTYSVLDNGEEAAGLSKQDAIEVIVENLVWDERDE